MTKLATVAKLNLSDSAKKDIANLLELSEDNFNKFVGALHSIPPALHLHPILDDVAKKMEASKGDYDARSITNMILGLTHLRMNNDVPVENFVSDILETIAD